jgi:hypothetical protein
MIKASTNQTPRAFEVLNPVAGNSNAETIHLALEQHFEDRNQPYEDYETIGANCSGVDKTREQVAYV